MMTNILFRYGDDFGYYIKGLTVIISKIFGVIITDKLRAILIFKADFKFSKKLYFGSVIMKRERFSRDLPQEKPGGSSGHTSF